MKSIESLKKLYKPSASIPQMQFISNESEMKIQDTIERVGNTFVVPILDMLSKNKHAKLVALLEKTKAESSLYNFIKFAEMLCADETDFDALTNPMNSDFYKKLKKFSEKFQKPIPCYVSILEKICDNKGWGLYSEFQEVEFFFQEVEKSENKDFTSTFEDYKRILTLQTQRIFAEFIRMNIFNHAQQILNQNRQKIADENTLIAYMYSTLFFALHLSNKNENLLIKHIEFYMQYLTKNGFIHFEKIEQKRYFSKAAGFSANLNWFFASHIFSGEQKSIALLKDYTLNDEGIVQFIEDFKKIQNGETIPIEKTASIENLATVVFQMDERNENILFLQLLFLIAGSESVNLEKIEHARELYKDGIIQNIRSILAQNKSKIPDARTLCFYIYAELYYNRAMSNKQEIALLHYIELFVVSLVKRGLRFDTVQKRQYFRQYSDLSQRLRMLFENETIIEKENVISCLKDYSLNDAEIVEFCGKLREIFAGKSVKIENDNSLAILEKVINNIDNKNDVVLFLKIVLEIRHKPDINLSQIKLAQNMIIFEELIKGHFENPYSDMQQLYSYRAKLGENFETLRYLFTTRKEVFYQIIACYQKNMDSDKTAEKLVGEYSDFTDKEKLKEIIKIFYEILIDKFNLHFYPGNTICDNNVYYGEIKAIFVRANQLYYSVQWTYNTENVLVENAYTFKLTERYSAPRQTGSNAKTSVAQKTKKNYINSPNNPYSESSQKQKAPDYNIGETFYHQTLGEGKIVGKLTRNGIPYYGVEWQTGWKEGKTEYIEVGKLFS